ncbi:MAG: hypothetical protein WCY29_17630 [Novosphingobium sp.]
MRKIALALATGAALTAGVAVEAKPRPSGEEQLAKILEGRVAGEPVNCISLSQARDQRVIDKTAIVYGSGRTIYVNRPANARDLDDDDIMVSNIHGSQVCSLDVVRMHDRTGHFYSGFVGLEKFVPYRRVASAD